MPKFAESAVVLNSPIIELRQYTLHDGMRDTLIDLFDSEFVESQEATGMSIIGQFRDLDDPNRFVWLRGFADMATRKRALTEFYGGPVWQRHRDAANAAMVDSDDVFLLRPATRGAGIVARHRNRPAPGATAVPETIVTATICSFHDPDAFPRFFDREVSPVLADCGAVPIGCLRTEPAANNFPALPIREDGNIYVCLARFDSREQLAAHQEQLEQSAVWNERVRPRLGERLSSAPQQLTLSPTARSLLR